MLTAEDKAKNPIASFLSLGTTPFVSQKVTIFAISQIIRFADPCWAQMTQNNPEKKYEKFENI